jgi:Icc-related predicted phosphoesterase
MKITFISDTHGKHKELSSNRLNLPGGDIIFHTGDFMKYGKWNDELLTFCNWFSALDNYTYKVFIAGNHDMVFQQTPKSAREIANAFNNIIYLEDSSVNLQIDGVNIKIYGSPWQPYFHNWAFNLPRNGKELEDKWKQIPEDTDILLTHTPPFGVLDTVLNKEDNHLGCELLKERLTELNVKIHAFGHIHSGRGIQHGKTNYINGANLDETYKYAYAPINIIWDKESNKINLNEN